MDGGRHTAPVLWAVNGNWNDDGWYFNANSIDNPNRWNRDNLFLSRYSLLPAAFSAAGFVRGVPSSNPQPFCRSLPRSFRVR